MDAADPIEIIRGDLAAFHAVPAGGPPADTQRYLQGLLEAQLTRPDWCLVARQGGRPVGRVALWGDATQARPSDIVLLDLPWERPHGELLGARLIRHCAVQVRAAGLATLRHVLDDPPRRPQWQCDTGRRISFLTGQGFMVKRCTRRYEWSGALHAPPTPRLHYRNLPSLGLPALEEVLRQVVTGSLDRIDQEQVQAQGPAEHARWLLQLLQQMDHQPGWWEVGYVGEEPAGLVLPTAGTGFGTIGYMGVVPRWRGHGHADELLARGTATLRAAGLTRLVSDTDIANAPMAAAFRRMGWNEFGRRTEYALAL